MRKFIQKNREVLLLVSSIAVLLSVLGYLYFKEDWGKSGEAYTTPLTTTQDVDHNWGNVTTLGDVDTVSVKSLEVYSPKGPDIETVRDLVRKFGLVMSSESVTEDSRYYSWSRQRDSAVYDDQSFSLSVYTTGVKLEDIKARTLTEENILSYADEFMSAYIDIDQEYSLTYERSGEGFKVLGTWTVGGYAVVGSYDEENLIRLVFGPLGTLESLSVYLVEFQEAGDSVEIVSIPVALAYVRAESYPKEVFFYPKPDSAQECATEGCVGYELTGLEGFSELQINSSQIVYLFSQYLAIDVLPVYQFRGEAAVPTDESSTYVMYATLYANAIDPAQVILGSQE